MKKPSMLYASPFPPIRSGISEYSATLVQELKKDFEITLYTDSGASEDRSPSGFRVLRPGEEPVNPMAFDYRVYNMGNQPDFHGYIYEMALACPGHVILHDVNLYYLFTGYHLRKEDFYSALYRNEGLHVLREILRYKRMHGVQDLLHCDALAAEYAMNMELLRTDNRFIVHSEYAKSRILSSVEMEEDRILKTGMIEQVEKESRRIRKEKLYRKYRIPKDALVLAAFGIISDTKLNRETAQAVREMNQAGGLPPICYVMVGEGSTADDLLDGRNTVKTGYVTISELNSMMEYADIVVNLRNPTRGETSAAMIRALQLGKPCITNNGGWFSEIPEDCVRKIELTDVETHLREEICDLITHPEAAREMGEKAKAYIRRESSRDRIRGEIFSFLTGNPA